MPTDLLPFQYLMMIAGSSEAQALRVELYQVKQVVKGMKELVG